MITFVTGKPGDGKSMYGMKLIVDCLVNTNRVIATNIAIKLPELRAYAMLKGWKPKPGNDIQDRVIQLSHEDVFEFYRFRSGGYVLPPSPDWERARNGGEDEDGKKLKKISRFDFLRHMTAQMREMKKHPRALRPVEYHIDEAHDYFSAREWTDTGRGILWYASKHRHLHDEIILYTQVMKNVEAQLRGLASFTVRARNQMRMRWGPFRKAPVFRLYEYYGAPEEVDKAQPFNGSVMQLDREGLCRTYNSAGALSVHSKPEEVKNKAPLPHWALPVACCLLVLFVAATFGFLPMLGGKFAGNFIRKSSGETAKVLGVPTPGSQDGPVNRSRAAAVNKSVPAQTEFSGSSVLEDGRNAALSVVEATMTIGETLVVKVEGYDWSPVRRMLDSGVFELANGVCVAKRDLLNVPRRKRVDTEAPDSGKGRSAALVAQSGAQ